METYTYSFIIAHHNSPKLLERLLKSIPQRDDIEIIVTDDNSPLDLRPRITRSDVKYIQIEAYESTGAGGARNKGLEMASGKWLLFADADDYYADRFIDVLDKYKSSELDVLYFCSESVDSETLEKVERLQNQVKFYEEYEKGIGSIDKIKYIHVPWNKMIRSNFIKKYNISFENVIQGNDTLFSYCVGYFAEKVKVINERLYVYTYTLNSITTQQKHYRHYYCMVGNQLKQQEFLKFVGHQNYGISLFRNIVRITKSKGLRDFLIIMQVLLTKWFDIYKKRFTYVDIIKEQAKNKIVVNDTKNI